MVNVLKLKQRYEALRSDRATEEQVWDEIEKFLMPLTGQTMQALQGATPAAKTDINLWDLTAPLALEHLAAALHSDITSPSTKWLDFEWTDEELEKDRDCVVYREALAALVWSELQASDFNMEISSGYMEWAGIGNMGLVCEPSTTAVGEWKGLDFTAVPLRQIQFEEDSRGGVARWFRHLRWTATQLVDHCEQERNADGTPKYPAPDKYKRMAEKPAETATKIDVIFCIYRRTDMPEEVMGEVPKEKRPFGCVYFTLEDAERLGEEGGYYRMPAVMGRWGKRPGTQWGYGRGHIALRQVKGLNYFKELQLNAAEKAVDPAMGASERVGSEVDLRPGRVTVVPSKDDLWAIESSARFDVSAEIIRDERIEIRRAFHEDDLQLKESPQMTATEVQARKDQMNRGIGSPAARLGTDVLSPIAMITLDHLARAKRTPPVPMLAKQRKGELKLRMRGPIARAQLMDEVVAIEREAAFVSNLLQLGFTNARHYFDLGAAIQEHSKRLGVPARVIKSPVEAQKAIDAEQAAMKAAMDAETAKTQGQAAASAASAASSMGIPIGPQPALVPSGGMTA
ncbi:MAG: hypothetical protein IPO00_08885 [Betaproteobacteria bacterium]|nr:hypothetical protein [Betaproteobacteria bacterium]